MREAFDGMIDLFSGTVHDIVERLRPFPTVGPTNAVGIIGFSLYITWGFVCLFSNALYPSNMPSLFGYVENEFVLRTIGLVSMVFCIYFIRRFSDRLVEPKESETSSSLAIVLSLLFGSVYFLCSAGLEVPIVVVGLSWVLFGLINMRLLWYSADFTSSLAVRQTLFTSALAFLLAGVFYRMVTLFDPIVSSGFVMLLPSVSILCLKTAGKEKRRRGCVKVDDSRDRVDLSRRTSFAILWIGVVFGFFLQVAFSSPGVSPGMFDETVSPEGAISLGFVLGGVFLCITSLIAKSNFVPFTIIQRIVHPLLVCGLLLFSAQVSPLLSTLSFAVVCTSVTLYDVSNWAALSALASKYEAQPLYHFSRGRGPYLVGCLIGWILGMGIMAVFHHEYPEAVSAAALVFVGCLSLSVAILPFVQPDLHLSSPRLKPGQSVKISNGIWGRACGQICDKYALSPREREIFVLLAKGRNAGYMEKKLFISQSTAKSHIHRIYHKIGIASHQDLLDLVEATVSISIAQDDIRAITRSEDSQII